MEKEREQDGEKERASLWQWKERVKYCLLDSFAAVLPPELEDVPDYFLHQLEGLLDLGPNEGGEVHHAHIHLHKHTQSCTQANTQEVNSDEVDPAAVNPLREKEREEKKRGSKGIERGRKVTQHALASWFRLPQ